MKKVLAVVGARPQFVKAAAIDRAWRDFKPKPFDLIWLNTGQHYDYRLSQIFFKELSLPKPKYNLKVGSFSHAAQTGMMLAGIESILLKEKPSAVLVFGDTNSTLAGALAASKINIPVAHVEAGLRSFNRAMPEEVNRVLTDAVSSVLFCPAKESCQRLFQEGIRKNVFESGDVMADVMRDCQKRLKPVVLGKYYLATIHRNTNTDDPKRLYRIFKTLGSLEGAVLMPLHPRTQKMVESNSDVKKLAGSLKNLKILKPQPYIKMLSLEKYAQGILTDSGGVQKEAFWFGVPCVTLRAETEWKETVAAGLNYLCEPDPEKVRVAFTKMKRFLPAKSRLPQGSASAKIIRVLSDYLKGRT